MSRFIQEEVSIFLEAAWYGMMIAASYDILRILRRIIKHSDILVSVEDFVFWVIAGIAIFAMIFQCNDGIVRGYIFLALFIGASLYHNSVSKVIVKYLSKILNFFLTFLLKKPLKWSRILITTLLKPIVRLQKGMKKGIRKKYEQHHDKKKEKREIGNLRH